MPRILIADDHALVRKGLALALADEIGKLVLGEAGNGPEALDLLRRQKWDLVVLDLNMEGMGGLEVLQEIRRAWPKLPVLILSMYPEEEFAVRAIRLGAAGYLNKRSASEELVAAVKKVLAGGRYVTPAVAERLAEDIQQPARLPHENLSPRELEVMRRIARGQSLKEIAADLGLSVKTIGTYHIRLLKKMGLDSDVDLARYAIRHKLVD
jgi:DNA-binding NarL/FixJ family response regulator